MIPNLYNKSRNDLNDWELLWGKQMRNDYQIKSNVIEFSFRWFA